MIFDDLFVLPMTVFIVSLLLFHCCSLITCYFYILFLSVFFESALLLSKHFIVRSTSVVFGACD